MAVVSVALFLLAVSGCLSSDGQAEAMTQDDPVVVLTSSSFDWFVKSHAVVLVDFYQSSCQHSKALEPVYREVASFAKTQGWSSKLAMVDGPKAHDLMVRYNIEMVPEIVLFENGKKSETYKGVPVDKAASEGRQLLRSRGPAKALAIQAWLQLRERSALVYLRESETASFKAKLEEGMFSMVAHVGKKSPEAKAYKKARKVLKNSTSSFRFGLVWSSEGEASLELSRAGFSEPDPPLLKFESKEWTAADIARWARIGTYPSVGNAFSVSRYGVAALEPLGLKGSMTLVLDDNSDVDEEPVRPRVLQEMQALAAAHPAWRFTTAELSSLKHADLLGLVASGDSPATPAAFVLKGESRYAFEYKFRGHQVEDAGTLTSFFEKVQQGEVRQVYKSQAIPPVELDEDGVFELVGSTFGDTVLDDSKSVLVNFYEPSCGYCQDLSPVWNRLAQFARKAGWAKRGLVIARMNGLENESEEGDDLRQHGFPRIVLYPAVQAEQKIREKRVYSGSRDLEGLVAFLKENIEGLDDSHAEL